MHAEAAFWLEEIRKLPPLQARLMEVCGTHTMSIARAGLKTLLPPGVELLSGPGCPVCVTASEQIDAALTLAMEPRLILACYGDMLRVPGSVPGDSLQRRRAQGARVELVYSPLDAVGLAAKNPDKEVVFLGVGFETTAPGTAAAVLAAREQGVKNFSVWSMLKTVEPALRALLAQKDVSVQAFLCPGHVATIIGAEGFRFLPEEYGLPAVVGGFEPAEILRALYLLLRQLSEGRAALENAYPRAVRAQGNQLARAMLERCLRARRDCWRGLGEIENSGLGLREELAAFDAEKKFGVSTPSAKQTTACRCGDVICGRCRPGDCPLFGAKCTPEDPVGPCMVSSEGACAAAYQYQTV
ncbi:MAG: hydrogenase formation protein HypD [Oscillospiraceae bacterium]|nr:hydrogenase formation protein HypD [Oscillospiraceae bacterium]